MCPVSHEQQKASQSARDATRLAEGNRLSLTKQPLTPTANAGPYSYILWEETELERGRDKTFYDLLTAADTDTDTDAFITETEREQIQRTEQS